MIQLPKRSVTRFFIPLIDVLTLLFCIFLVMPLAQNTDQTQTTALEAELERLREQGADTRALQAELEKMRLAGRFPPTRVLEIDAKTGRLFYLDPSRVEIQDADAAKKLVESDRKALADRKAELYYLILYPRDRTSEHPLNSELDAYTSWFKDIQGVKLKYDIPGKGLIQGS